MATATSAAPVFHPGQMPAENPGPIPQAKTPKSKFINSLQSPEHTPNTTASTPSPSSKTPQLKGHFYAIRKGRGVKGCIFATWDTAKEHVHNYKEAVYNVFDKMEDALLYIRLPSKANGTKPLIQNRKRTAVLPCSSATASNNKKPRTVSIVQQQPMPARKVSLCLSSQDKENEVPTQVTVTKMKVQPTTEESEETAVEDNRPLPKILEEGYKQSYVKGWRANALFPQKKQCREKWEKRYLEDVATLKEFRGNKNASVRDVHNTRHLSGIPNAFSLAYLNWSWGVGEAYHRFLNFSRRRNTQKPAGNRQRMKNNKLKVAPVNKSSLHSRSTCVITNREAARKRFTSRAMFYSFRVQQLAEMTATGKTKDQLPTRPEGDELHNKSPLVNGCSRSKDSMDQARSDWETLSPEDKAFWEEQERLHDAKQPEILSILEAALARDPKRSAKRLSEDIGFWCGKTTIGKWKNLRIGPSYRKGISNPVSREEQQAQMNTSSERAVLVPVSNAALNNGVKAAALPRAVSEPCSGDENVAAIKGSKKAEMVAVMEEENLVI